MALHGAAARRRRRPRRRHPVAARRLGGVAATSRTSPTRSSTARCAASASASTSSTTPHTCPNCGAKDSFTEARQFNLMFKTFAGPVEEDAAVAYLRPETAQGMFVNFANVLQTTRKKPPFGIAQVGKSFRNEITPQNWIFRTREFEQMEMEFFVPPAEAAAVVRVLVRRAAATGTSSSASRPSMLRLRAHDADELSHYSSGTSRRGVPVPVGLGRARGHRQPHRLRPHPARHPLGRAARLLRPGDGRALRAARDRAGGRRHPHDGGVPPGRLRRGRGRRRGPHRAAPPPPPGAVQGGGAAAVEEGHAARRWPGRCSALLRPRVHVSTTTTPSRSDAATAARTRSARRWPSPSTSTRSRTRPSPSATATRPSRSASPSTASSTRSNPASNRLTRFSRDQCARCGVDRYEPPSSGGAGWAGAPPPVGGVGVAEQRQGLGHQLGHRRVGVGLVEPGPVVGRPAQVPRVQHRLLQHQPGVEVAHRRRIGHQLDQRHELLAGGVDGRHPRPAAPLSASTSSPRAVPSWPAWCRTKARYHGDGE